jgi:molybdopterin-containing oxidoreductase family membrane subunit
MKKVNFQQLTGSSRVYWLWIALFGAVAAVAYGSALHMEHEGHWITGMTNQVVWGLPHVFAIFLIVAASGALNVASIGSVFGKLPYKPLARLSGLLAVALLVGGMWVLVLDLGRADRLIIAMTKYNFKSIFAWNIILYIGFMAIVVVYLWTMMDRSNEARTLNRPAGFTAFAWRLILTTGTGSIFGFLVARPGYNSAVMAPMFILMSFAFGLAIFILMLMAIYRWDHRPLSDSMVFRLKNLLGVCVAAVVFITIIFHLTNLYITEHHAYEAFILRDGGLYTQLFWYGQIIVGSLIPMALFYAPGTSKSRVAIGFGALLVILGGFAQVYVIVVGGQAFPMAVFPGYEVSSSFFDGVVMSYTPSLWELILGIGGVAVSVLLVSAVLRVLPFAPTSLADSE